MATVNFSVPEEVKIEFDKAFGDQNKSFIIADLMRGLCVSANFKSGGNDCFVNSVSRAAAGPPSPARKYAGRDP